jgi:hypothetical protein
MEVSKMSQVLNVGDKVKWKWGAGWGRGEIAERFTNDVTRQIKGTDVSRKATSDSPAYLIQQDDGDGVLKSHSEVEEDV